MKKFTISMVIVLIFVLSVSSFSQHPDKKINLLSGPENYTRDHTYDALHYKLVATVFDDKRMMEATCTITFSPMFSGFKKMHLDAADMEIKKVYYPGGDELKYVYRNDSLSVLFDKPYNYEDEIKIAVDYKIEPETGLNFIKEDKDTPPHFYTMFQPSRARYFIPCFDSPNDKATSETIITVKDTYLLLSNGKLLSVKDNNDGTKTFHWLQEKPHCTYLISIVGGEYYVIKEKYRDIPVDYYVYESHKDIAMNSFKNTKKMIEIFEDKFGYTYPWYKYDQSIVGGPVGGMEHTSATTLGVRTIHDDRAAIDYSSDGLVSHELSHMWFGDLITCKNWGELWLNESFAVYSEIIYTENFKNFEEARYNLLSDYNVYLTEAYNRYIRPVSTKVYNSAGDMFDRHAYNKGGCILHTLRFVLGDELFFRSLKYYLHKYEFKSVETADFRIAIEEATGRNLEWFFDSWIYQAGHPVFEVKYDWDEKEKVVNLYVDQIQVRPDTVGIFKTPVDIEITTENGKTTKRFFIDQKKHTFKIESDSKPLMVRFDKNNWILKELVFEKSKEELLYQIKNDDDFYGRILAIEKLKEMKEDEDAKKAIIDRLKNDPFSGVRKEAADALLFFKDDETINALKEAYKDNSQRVRVEAISTLAMFREKELKPFFVEIFNNAKSYKLMNEALRGALNAEKEVDKELLYKALDTDSHNDMIRQTAMFNVSKLSDEEALNLAMKYVEPMYDVGIRYAAVNILARIGKDNEQIKDKLIELLDDKNYFIKMMAISSIGRLGNKEVLPKLKEMLRETKNDRLIRVIKRTIKRLE